MSKCESSTSNNTGSIQYHYPGRSRWNHRFAKVKETYATLNGGFALPNQQFLIPDNDEIVWIATEWRCFQPGGPAKSASLAKGDRRNFAGEQHELRVPQQLVA